MIRPSGIGGELTLLSKADTKILHCVGKGITDAKSIEAEIGLSTKQIYARALTLKKKGLLEDRKGIHLNDTELSARLALFLSVSLERADVLANMGIRFLIALGDPAPGRIVANRTGVSEATYFEWYRNVAHTGIVGSDNGIHYVRYDLWPELSELLGLIERESRSMDNRIPEDSRVIWMDEDRILFSDVSGKQFQKTAFSVFSTVDNSGMDFYTTSKEPLNEQNLFDDAVRICESTDDPNLRLKTIDYLLNNLENVIPDNNFVRHLDRTVKGLECKGWPNVTILEREFGDLSELVRCMIPYEGTKIPYDYRTETFKLYPNRTQKHTLDLVLETCRLLYNELLEIYLPEVLERRMPCESDIRKKMVHELKVGSIHKQLYNNAPSLALVDVCSRVYRCLSKLNNNILSGREVRIPKPKKKVRSFTYVQIKGAVSFPSRQNDTKKIIRLGKIDDIRYDGHTVMTDGKRFTSSGKRIPFDNPVPGEMKRCRVVKMDDGQWYVQIVYRSLRSEPDSYIPNHQRTPIGIDLGITNIITTSEGVHIPNFRELSKIKIKISREQSRMDRIDKDTIERERYRMRLAHLYRHYNNRCKDNLHKLSLNLVRNHDLIVFEDINIKKLIMKEGGKKLKSGLSEACWRKLTDMVDYKSIPMGTRVIYVDPRNTSQLCSRCKHIVKKNLSVRIHECPYCGLQIDRDENAAINILLRGKEEMVRTPGIEPEFQRWQR